MADRERVFGLLWAYETSAAIGAVARLGIADALAGGPLPAREIAVRVGTDAGALERLLRSLIDVGLVRLLPDGTFALSEDGEFLRGDVPESLRAAAIYATDEWWWRSYGYLTHSVQTGQPGFVAAHGRGLWEYLESHPDAAAAFNRAMGKSAERRATTFARCYDFAEIKSVVDVGGGDGALVEAVLKAHPQLRGVVFDLPSATAGAGPRMAAAGVADRCEVIGGDFFQTVPADGDAYVLSWIVHDWPDREATRILANIRQAVSEQGRLLVIEAVLDPNDPAGMHTSVDLTMLVATGGHERSEAEFRDLYESAGFELTRVLPLESLPWSVIEGRPR